MRIKNMLFVAAHLMLLNVILQVKNCLNKLVFIEKWMQFHLHALRFNLFHTFDTQ